MSELIAGTLQLRVWQLEDEVAELRAALTVKRARKPGPQGGGARMKSVLAFLETLPAGADASANEIFNGVFLADPSATPSAVFVAVNKMARRGQIKRCGILMKFRYRLPTEEEKAEQ